MGEGNNRGRSEDRKDVKWGFAMTTEAPNQSGVGHLLFRSLTDSSRFYGLPIAQLLAVAFSQHPTTTNRLTMIPRQDIPVLA